MNLPARGGDKQAESKSSLIPWPLMWANTGYRMGVLISGDLDLGLVFHLK